MHSDHEITRIICHKLDQRKKKLHIAGEDHFFDEVCHKYRMAIKDMGHPYRLNFIKKPEKPKKKKKKKNKRRKQQDRNTRRAVKRTIPRVRPWMSHEEWVEDTKRFYASREWKEMRYFVLRRDGAICACCGDSPANGASMRVDHIKVRSVYPELELDPNNLQVLCDPCNVGKCNYYNDDWRVKMD
jgi:5-methylcytosine-specific restriction endonuclease McrA